MILKGSKQPLEGGRFERNVTILLLVGNDSRLESFMPCGHWLGSIVGKCGLVSKFFKPLLYAEPEGILVNCLMGLAWDILVVRN